MSSGNLEQLKRVKRGRERSQVKRGGAGWGPSSESPLGEREALRERVNCG